MASLMVGRRVVAVAGTHGKTTTTSLLTVALQAAGADPTYAIGGDARRHRRERRRGLERPLRRGGGRERRRVPRLLAVAAIVTNVEADHLDHWGTDEAYAAAFDEFADTIAARLDSWSAASTTRARPALAERQRAAGRRVVTVSTRAGTADVGPERPGRRRAVVARRPLPRRRPARPRGGPRAGLRRAPTWSAASRRSPAPGAGWSEGRGRRRAGLRQLRAPPDRDRRRPRRCPRAGRRRAGSSWPSSRTWSRGPACSAPRWATRSAPPTRWWSATSTWPARIADPEVTGALVAAAVPLPPSTSPSCPTSTTSRPPWSPGRGRATWC